ncbi:hypothetical protein [Nannocystis pusilla]|uniref:PAS domain-containing protein n=1 Tax=Nannocystis pusilla TaxID=889268 RepID=A0ABS7TVW3_9BACT|nr:hypothetical protein [Nannocystis pusilla]MBZ5712285.1 hypothetical protein [Nannocystis pusilla]
MSYLEPISAMNLDPAGWLDAQGVVAAENDSWTPAFGHSPNDLVGNPSMGLWPPQEAEHLGRWLVELEAAGHGTPFIVELPLRQERKQQQRV